MRGSTPPEIVESETNVLILLSGTPISSIPSILILNLVNKGRLVKG
jgi:hypothetical protein